MNQLELFAKIFRRIVLIIFLTSLFSLGFSQSICDRHVLQVVFNNILSTSTNNFTILSSNSNTNACILESDLLTNTADKIRLHRIEPTENFSLDVLADDLTLSKNISFGFSSFETDTREYKFVLEENNKFKAVVTANNVVIYSSSTMTYNSASIFRIAKCENKVGFIYNNNEIKVFTFDQNVPRYEAFVQSISALSAELFLQLLWEEECSPFNRFSRYSVVNTSIPISTTLIEDRKLRFFFFQKYAIVASENDIMKLEVFDNSHNLVHTYNNIPITYGNNYKEVDLSMLAGAINNYICVFTGANKKDVYYLRINEN